MLYESQIKIVPGKKGKDIMLFTLSTCIWCQKTKALFKDLGIGYSYLDVDLLEDKAQEEAYDELLKYNKSTSFPTIVINNGEEVLLGFQEDAIKKLN